MHSPLPRVVLALLTLPIAPAIAESVTNIFLPGMTGSNFQASVVNAESTAATYSIVCTNGANCGFISGASVTVAATSAGYLYSQASGTVTLNCAGTSGTPTACSGTASIDSGPTTATSVTGSAIGKAAQVSITSGEQKLTAPASGAMAGGAANGGSSATATAGASSMTGGAGAGGMPSGTSGAPSVQVTGPTVQPSVQVTNAGARVRAGAGGVGAALALAPLFL